MNPESFIQLRFLLHSISLSLVQCYALCAPSFVKDIVKHVA